MATAQEQDELRRMIMTFRVTELQMLLGKLLDVVFTIFLVFIDHSHSQLQFAALDETSHLKKLICCFAN